MAVGHLGTLEEGVEDQHDCYDLIRRSAEMRRRSAVACAEAAEIAVCSAELASRAAELHEAARRFLEELPEARDRCVGGHQRRRSPSSPSSALK